MGGRSDRSLAALLLTQRLVDASVPPLKASEYWSVIERISDPAQLLGSDAAAVAIGAGIENDLAERIARLLDGATGFAFELDEAQQSGLRIIASVDDEYPSVLVDRLRHGAPPLLYMAGDPALVGPSLLGIVGSREVDEAAASVAREAA